MKRIGSILLRAVGLLALAALLLFGFVQTPPGKRMLARSAMALLGRIDGLQVRIDGLGGWIPGHVRMGRLEISDATGPWLSANGIACRWNLLALRDGKIHLESLSADEIELFRLPRYSGSGGVGGAPELDVRLDGLQIDRFHLGAEIAGVELEYAIQSGGIALNPEGRLSGEFHVEGDAEGRVALEALLPGGGKNQLTLTAELDRLAKPDFGLDRVSGRGEATLSGDGVDATVSAEIEKDSLAGRLTSRLRYANHELRAEQFRYEDGRFSAAGDATLGFSTGRVAVAVDASLTDPSTNLYMVAGVAEVGISNQAWSVGLRSLEIGCFDGMGVTFSGVVDSGKIELLGEVAECEIGRIPLAGLEHFEGTLRGGLSVAGLLASPRIAGSLEVEGLASAQDALDELPPLDVRITAGYADGRLFAATAITNTSSGHLEADFSMPCLFSLDPLRFAPDPAKTQARLKGDFDIGLLNQLAVFENQHLAGSVVADLALGLGRPSGFIRVENGRYEHYDLGIAFRNLSAELEADGSRLIFKHASGSDGFGGSVGLSGGLGRNGMALDVELVRAKVIRSEAVDGTVSGSLSIAGALSRPLVSGTLVIDRAEILLDNFVSPAPPLLTDFDAHAAATNAASPAIVRKPFPVGLDVEVKMPDQIYVTASLIDSVWGGSLHVSDTPQGVAIKGKVEPRRGFVDFIGKKFRFQGGEVLLDGSVPPVAVMNNLVAEYERSDITARLVLNGKISNPRYRLESTPSLPEDEILSHVLFNRDTSSISPYQAYQIAAAARQLSEGVNGPGFMYQVRRVVGVDTLEWREGDAAGDASSVAAGKYLATGLYVEVNRSLDAEGETGMVAEYELTRHISVETSTGPKLRPGIGVNLKYDF